MNRIEKVPKYSLPMIGDFCLIILNISHNTTVIPNALFRIDNLGLINVVFFIVNFFYILIRFKGGIHKIKSQKLLFLLLAFFLLYIIEIIKSPFIINGRFEYSLALTFHMITFIALLNNCYKEYSLKYGTKVGLELILKFYIVFSIYIITTTILAFFLFKLNVLSPYTNSVSYGIMQSNISQAGTKYYFPGYLSILETNVHFVARIPLLQEHGLICGLSHEPHLASYIVAPSLLFLIAIKKFSKSTLLLIVCSFMLFFVLASSATNFLLIIALTIIGAFIYYINIKKNIIVTIGILLLFVFMTTAIIYNSDDFILLVENSNLAFVANKLNPSSGSGSLEYSTNRIFYMLNPSTVMGTTLFSTSIEDGNDIGFIPFVFNLLILVSLFWNSFKLIMTKNKKYFYTGLGVLYFLLHSMKINLLIYRSPYTLFIIFILIISLEAAKTEREQAIM